MADERLVDFPAKPTPTPSDIIYTGDAANAYNEVKSTIGQVIGAFPGLLSLGSLTTIANQMIYTTAPNTYATSPITAFARSLLDDIDAPTAATTLQVLPLSGGTLTGVLTMTDTLDMGGNRIFGVATPITNTDAANKQYVDNAIASPSFVAQCATSANLAGYTYANGTFGVGATLTAGSNAAFATDGVSPTVNQVVLVANQTNAYENGLYNLTQVGSVSLPAILTRATDYDQPGEINPGDTVVVLQGTLYQGTQWIQLDVVLSVGVDAINFDLINQPQFLVKANNLSDVANVTTSFNNISPMTTKGDLIGFNGTNNARLAVGTNGFVLKANSAATFGFEWAALAVGITAVVMQVITASGNYTPTSGTAFTFFRMVGGGGSGGGAPGGVGLVNSGGGGGGGCYAEGIIVAPGVISCTIGAGGTSTGAAAGNAGGFSLIPTWAQVNGGAGGGTGAASAIATSANGGAGGAFLGGIAPFSLAGGSGGAGWSIGTTLGQSGFGGSTPFGEGGRQRVAGSGSGASNGLAGTGYGAGSGGALAFGNVNGTNVAGQPGVIVFLDFVT